jgi:hypothetical protein
VTCNSRPACGPKSFRALFSKNDLLRFFEPDLNFGAGGLVRAVIWARPTLRELFHDFCQAIDFGVDSRGCLGRCFGTACVILRPITELNQMAQTRDTTAANWVRSLTVVHLSGRPQWSANELNELRTISDHLRRIGSDINVIAGIINGAVRTGAYLPEQGLAVKEAAELVRYEGRRLAAVMTGNFDYWGLPTDQRPKARPGAIELATLQAELAEAKRREQQRNQLRRRYSEDEDGN